MQILLAHVPWWCVIVIFTKIKVYMGISVLLPIPKTAWAVSERDSNNKAMSVIFISTTAMCRNGAWGGIINVGGGRQT